MIIKTDRRIIKGEHLGIPFEFEDGLLMIYGQTYSKAEIKILINLANLLELEGFKLVECKPDKAISLRKPLWSKFYFEMDESEENEGQI